VGGRELLFFFLFFSPAPPLPFLPFFPLPLQERMALCWRQATIRMRFLVFPSFSPPLPLQNTQLITRERGRSRRHGGSFLSFFSFGNFSFPPPLAPPLLQLTGFLLHALQKLRRLALSFFFSLSFVPLFLLLSSVLLESCQDGFKK